MARWCGLLVLFTVWGWHVTVAAYVLTEADYATLKTDITVTHVGEFQGALDSADFAAIAAAYNAQATPTFWVWRTLLTEKEIYEARSPDATTWDWATYKGQPAQDRDAWARMMAPGAVNPSLAQTRAGWASIFGLQGPSGAQVSYLLSLARRLALRAEVLFVVAASGDGSTTTPSTVTWEGQLTARQIYHAITGGPL
jgi:hypothetical protein